MLSQVKEKYERVGIITPKLGEKVPEDVLEDEQGNVTFTITMPQKGIVLLKTGINVPSSIIAKVTDTTKKKASDRAYRLAVTY